MKLSVFKSIMESTNKEDILEFAFINNHQMDCTVLNPDSWGYEIIGDGAYIWHRHAGRGIRIKKTWDTKFNEPVVENYLPIKSYYDIDFIRGITIKDPDGNMEEYLDVTKASVKAKTNGKGQYYEDIEN